MNCELCNHTPDKMYAMSTTDTNNLANLGVFQNDTIDDNTKIHNDALGQRIWKSKKIYWKCESYYDEKK